MLLLVSIFNSLQRGGCVYLTPHNNPDECELWYLTQLGLVPFTYITIHFYLSLKYKYTDKVFLISLGVWGHCLGFFLFFFFFFDISKSIQLVVYTSTIFSSLMFYVSGFYFCIIYHGAGQIILPYYLRR